MIFTGVEMEIYSINLYNMKDLHLVRGTLYEKRSIIGC